MNREEILRNSRKENKNQDIYEKEVLKEGGNYGAIVAVILATIFFVIQALAGKGMNYGLYAVVFSVPMTVFIAKYLKLKRKHELVVAMLYIIGVIMFSAAHIYHLVSASAVL